MKPIIAINLDWEDGQPPLASIEAPYLQAVAKAGGIPVLLPPTSDEDLPLVLKHFNGVLLIGGRDYNPSLWNEPLAQNGKLCSPTREDFDLRLARFCLKQRDLPVLGICAGLQMLNIALGGTLIQDIPTELPQSKVQHTSQDRWALGCNQHTVELVEGSALAKLYPQKAFPVPTSHHQAIGKLGSGLKATAFAQDGIIEAIEHENNPRLLGVQWHPECDYETNKSLFEEFIKQAARVSIAAGT